MRVLLKRTEFFDAIEKRLMHKTFKINNAGKTFMRYFNTCRF
jgi:hypothetical protein